MRILIPALLLLLCAACAQSPEAAYREASGAWAARDAGRFLRCLSRASITRMDSMMRLLESNPAYRAENIRSREDFIKLQFRHPWGGDPSSRLFGRSIRMVNTNVSDASIELDDGMRLYFVREDGAWKLDISLQSFP
jgi:hypothetical protein